MRVQKSGVILLISVFCLGVLAQSVRRIQFPLGRTTAVVKGTLKGSAEVTYLLRAKKGQTLLAHLAVARNEDASLLIKGPGGTQLQNADGSDAGDDFSVTLPGTGDYSLVVFPPDTAGRNDLAHYTLEVTVR
jgi:hypothetical protein